MPATSTARIERIAPASFTSTWRSARADQRRAAQLGAQRLDAARELRVGDGDERHLVLAHAEGEVRRVLPPPRAPVPAGPDLAQSPAVPPPQRLQRAAAADPEALVARARR